MRTHFPLLAIFLAGSVLAAPKPETADAALVEAGRGIYEQGILPDGAPLQGVREGGTVASGRDAACVLCHQRSGMGLAEGASLVPPVTATALFGKLKLASYGRAPRRAPGMEFKDWPFKTRPPYNEATLAQAMRTGVSPSGHRFQYMMPRYELGDADMKALIAYLRVLSAKPSPGVDSREAHFATIIAPGVDQARRDAYLGVLRACFREKSPDTDTSQDIPALPTWRLNVWELEGKPESWQAQLDAKYAARPVFAMVSGLGADEWEPVERFCESRGVPCLFPNVDVAGSSEGRRYVDRGGTILFFAPTEPNATTPMNLWDLWRNCNSLIMSYAGPPDDTATSIELIRAGRVRVRELITHRLPLAETALGFKLVAEARESIKVIIEPQK